MPASAVDPAGAVLVVGKDGQLGRHLCRRFAGRRLVAMGRDDLNLADRDSIRRAVASVKPAVIVNAAAYTNVDAAEQAPADAFAVNRDGVRHMAEVAAETDAALLHVSTDYVFDGVAGAPYGEAAAAAPVNSYGASKLAGEAAVAESGARHLILRTSWLFSEFPGNFVTRILQLLGERESLDVVEDQIGSPTDAACLADVIARIVSAGAPELFAAGPGRVLHVANGGFATRFALAGHILARAREMGLPLRCAEIRPIATAAYPLPAARPADSRLATDRLRTDYGIVPPSWQSSVDRVLAAIISPVVT
ncbi:MAG TPA: dTDP-4-dehydrorhamnose reductase [Alphaproteobacteria bacterium]